MEDELNIFCLFRIFELEVALIIIVASWGLIDGTTLTVLPLCSLIGPKIQELEIGETMR